MAYDKKLAEALVLDELFDLSLYRELHTFASPELKKILEELIPLEETHVAFWKKFFKREDITQLNFGRKAKLWFIKQFCRVFKDQGIHLVLEAVEVYGIRKYLSVWNAYKNDDLGNAVKKILRDEFKHEDDLVASAAARKINPERIRNIFIGLNDGLVEILGAVSGFFAAFGNTTSVLIAGSTVAVAGAISMAAGSYVAISSEAEINRTELGKKNFLENANEPVEIGDKPVRSAMIVGISYLIGALVPILPVLFGATSAIISIIAAGIVIIATSMLLAFLSGMKIKKRILTNLVIIAAAVGISYGIGLLVKSVWGINI